MATMLQDVFIQRNELRKWPASYWVVKTVYRGYRSIEKVQVSKIRKHTHTKKTKQKHPIKKNTKIKFRKFDPTDNFTRVNQPFITPDHLANIFCKKYYLVCRFANTLPYVLSIIPIYCTFRYQTFVRKNAIKVIITLPS